MKNLFKTTGIFILILLISSCSEIQNQKSVNGIAVVDDIGNRVLIDSIPQRVISLAPNLTEIIFDLNAGNKIVGNTLYCNFPAAARNVEKVGDLLTVDFEKVLSLNPDIIFITVEGNRKETFDKFKSLGLKLFVSNPRNYEGIKKSYLDIARILDREKYARKKIERWDKLLDSIRIKSSNNQPKTAMIPVELKPLMLAGKNTFLNEYLEVCGLKNVADNPTINYPVFNREEILIRNPDFIIILSDGKLSTNNLLELYPEWKDLKAIQNGNVIFVDRDLYSRPGPRFVEAATDLFNRLHPKGGLRYPVQ
ncbi:ABC transporter substrate-binding protein [Melioribacter sp. OK-6-Me]|uniref:ABC transporter substrate-binding protein n=1 Tax=unclassified Melioribacter TaxID=2627329 RepID=UPI003ED989F9